MNGRTGFALSCICLSSVLLITSFGAFGQLHHCLLDVLDDAHKTGESFKIDVFKYRSSIEIVDMVYRKPWVCSDPHI